ncbi:MAG: hypothetical protein ABI321_21980 [Polyangia bacterium]
MMRLAFVAPEGRSGAPGRRLARALVPVAHGALSLPRARASEDEPLLEAALEAIDAFLEAPEASRYLVATRTLRTLSRLRQRSTDLEKLARRSLDGELERLRVRAVLPDEETLDRLRALPPDPRAGRRLQALGALLEAHRLLAVRVRAPETHRAKIVPPKEAKKDPKIATRKRTDRRAKK